MWCGGTCLKNDKKRNISVSIGFDECNKIVHTPWLCCKPHTT